LVAAICEEDPELPSNLAPHPLRHRLAGDVDAIVLKAMAKKPQDRYSSAQELAEDVRRHLADLPVVARPETWWDRARRRARRHKLELLAVLLVLAFAVTATVFWRQAEHQRSQAEDARLQAERVSGFLTKLFESAGPDAAPGEEMKVREALERGRRELERELQDEPEVRAELVGTLGTVYGQLGLYGDALELKEEALRIRRDAGGEDRTALAKDVNNLAKALYDVGDYEGAERRFREALAIWRRLGDESWITAARNLAAALSQQGRQDEALELHDQILEAQRSLYGPKDLEVAKSLHSLGALYRSRGEDAAAEPLLREALEIFTEKLGRRHTRVASVLASLGLVLHAQGRLAEARECTEEALRLRLELLGESHVSVANSRKSLAAILLDLGEPAAAAELLGPALEARGDEERAAANHAAAPSEN
jgi:tetratricopeptide (TPR) repeat protein